MTTLAALWLPILLSAIAVFLVSSVVHMVMQIHKRDYLGLPEEAKVLDALRSAKVPPGQYMLPFPGSMKEMRSPEMLAKFQQGPVGTLILRPTGMPNMGKSLAQWFAFCVVISIFVAHIGGQTLAPGAASLRVFQVTGAIAVLGHAFSSVTDSIWKGLSWNTTVKFVFDGLLYSVTTAATFAWLWPAAA